MRYDIWRSFTLSVISVNSARIAKTSELLRFTAISIGVFCLGAETAVGSTLKYEDHHIQKIWSVIQKADKPEVQQDTNEVTLVLIDGILQKSPIRTHITGVHLKWVQFLSKLANRKATKL